MALSNLAFAITSSSADSIKRLKEMATDHEISSLLVKDDVCIGSLVLILSNRDISLIQLALETIERLAQWPDLRDFLKDFIGMEDQLISLMTFACPPVRKLAHHIHDLLYNSVRHDDSLSESRFFGLSNCLSGKKRRNSFLVNNVNRPKTVIFVIQGLENKDDVDVCRELLLQVKGIISITFDLKKKRTVLRTKAELHPQVIAKAIMKNSEYLAEQLVKNQDGTETLVSFESNSNMMDNVSMPNYPPVNESTIIGDQNMIPCDHKFTDGPTWSFLRSVGSFLSNSFYW